MTMLCAYCCGSRCSKCWNYDAKKKCFTKEPCLDTCGFRKVTFSGDATNDEFGKWLFTKSHTGYIVMAHNLKGIFFFFGFLLFFVHVNYKHFFCFVIF